MFKNVNNEYMKRPSHQGSLFRIRTNKLMKFIKILILISYIAVHACYFLMYIVGVE